MTPTLLGYQQFWLSAVSNNHKEGTEYPILGPTGTCSLFQQIADA